MPVSTTLPQDDLTPVPAAVRAAEVAGYDGVATSENRNDPFLALGVTAANGSRLEIATGVAFSRSPMPVANAAWDLQVAARGRFVFGLGSQVRAPDENRFSVAWSTPVPRLCERVEEFEGRFGKVAAAVRLSGDGGVRQEIPPHLIQDIRRVPTAFASFRTAW